MHNHDPSHLLSLATNRASKVDLLIREGEFDMAIKFAERLCFDTLGTLAGNPRISIDTAAALARVASNAHNRASVHRTRVPHHV